MPAILSDLRKRFILISPLLVIGLGYLAARFSSSLPDPWAWLPLVVVFWGLTAGLILTGGRRAWIIRWLSRPRRSWGWSLAAVIIGLLPLFLLAAGPGTGKTMQLAPWIIFVLVNPWFEEWYWRGLLLDAASIWPEWLGIVYAGVMFAFSYPLVWGVFFESGRAPAFILITLTAGILWGVVYRRTGSLRWVVIGHLLLDVFGLAAPILWNLHFPI